MRPIIVTVLKANEADDTSSIASYDVFQNLVIKKGTLNFELGKNRNIEINIKKNIPTEGYEFSTYLIKVNNTVLKMQIWDMCGNENYRSALFNLYRNAVVGILVYSVCSRESFNNLENWITNLKKYALPWSKLILLGNKCDDELKREVTFEEGKKICDKYNLLFFEEISAKNGFNSPNFLELIAISLYQDYENNKDDDNDISATLMNRTKII